eukprot:CAMPEP_0202384022 /NCGR_PEP_ID=MMETSP1127-20130417/52650_1 /ASSEMBLY_ACC=CAM_ASM_000462 /TAXON_ID=3047 /ORGANISM="Dunaliella tertiolecta, Strain CCMP1320" /LENGTH=114 /DNA_ID=CAMNT_0048983679 /DNA_START=1537 /DNA_END=1882 /DNA_ORIENTATION=-
MVINLVHAARVENAAGSPAAIHLSQLLEHQRVTLVHIPLVPLLADGKALLLLGGHGGTSTWYGWHGIVDGGALGLVLLPGTCGSADLEGGFKDVWLFGAWKTAGGSCWMRVSLA